MVEGAAANGCDRGWYDGLFASGHKCVGGCLYYGVTLFARVIHLVPLRHSHAGHLTVVAERVLLADGCHLGRQVDLGHVRGGAKGNCFDGCRRGRDAD